MFKIKPPTINNPPIQKKPFLIPTYTPEEILGDGFINIKPSFTPSGKGQLTNWNFTPTTKQEFINLITVGLNWKEAAITCKLPLLDVKACIKMNKDGIKGDIAQAMMKRKVIHLSRLAQGQKNWQASAFYLERRFPQEFGRESTVNVVNEKRQVMIVNNQEVEF